MAMNAARKAKPQHKDGAYQRLDFYESAGGGYNATLTTSAGNVVPFCKSGKKTWRRIEPVLAHVAEQFGFVPAIYINLGVHS